MSHYPSETCTQQSKIRQPSSRQREGPRFPKHLAVYSLSFVAPLRTLNPVQVSLSLRYQHASISFTHRHKGNHHGRDHQPGCHIDAHLQPDLGKHQLLADPLRDTAECGTRKRQERSASCFGREQCTDELLESQRVER